MSLGAYYRKYSMYSAHELDISDETLKAQLKALILSNESVRQAIGSNLPKFLNAAVAEFKGNILKAAAIKKCDIKGDTVVVNTSGNNYQLVRDLVNAGFQTTNAYDLSTFFDRVGTAAGTGTVAVPTTKRDRFGLDIGHAHSNVVSAYGAVVLNSIRQSKIDLSSSELKDSINELYKAMKDPGTVETLMQMSGITSREVFDSCVDATVGLTRRIVNNELEVVLKSEPKLDRTTIQKIAMQLVDKVFPEHAVAQQRVGSTLEQNIANHLSKVSTGYFLKLFNDLSRKNASVHIVDLKGSPSGKDLALDLIEELITKKPRKSKGTVTSSTKVKATKQPPKNSLPKPKKAVAKAPTTKVPKLRDIRGRFTSVTKLENLINEALFEAIKRNMHRPNLNFQTGRFASSVKVDKIVNRESELVAFLSYMRYPYATFEPGGRQGHKGYDPIRLINQSVRDVATKLVTARMRVVVV